MGEVEMNVDAGLEPPFSPAIQAVQIHSGYCEIELVSGRADTVKLSVDVRHVWFQTLTSLAARTFS